MLSLKTTISPLFFLLMLCVSNSGASECSPVRVNGVRSWYPLSYRQEPGAPLQGIMVDVAREIFSRLELPVKIDSNKPWKRILFDLYANNIDIITGAHFNAERNQRYLYSDPVLSSAVHVFVHPDKQFTLNSLADLDHKAGVKIFGASYGEKLDHFFQTHPNIQAIKDDEKLVQLIARKRMDFAVMSLFDGLASAKRLGLQEEFIALQPNIGVLNIYFLIGRGSPCQEKITQINQQIKKLIASGFVEARTKHHLEQLGLIYE